MTIALISDIHANLPALEAVMKDIGDRLPDAVYCLGDLVGYNVWPNEVIEQIRKRRIATLAGNHDLKVRDILPDAKSYAYNIVHEHHKKYLLSLPAHILLEYGEDDDKFNMLFVHGSPRSVNEYLLEDLTNRICFRS